MPTKQNIAYLDCGHFFCKECLKDYFTYNIKVGSVSHIKCPNSECITEVLASAIDNYVSADSF